MAKKPIDELELVRFAMMGVVIVASICLIVGGPTKGVSPTMKTLCPVLLATAVIAYFVFRFFGLPIIVQRRSVEGVNLAHWCVPPSLVDSEIITIGFSLSSIFMYFSKQVIMLSAVGFVVPLLTVLIRSQKRRKAGSKNG